MIGTKALQYSVLRSEALYKLTYMILSFSVALVGFGFILLGVTLLPVVGILIGIGFISLSYYMWGARTALAVRTVSIQIPTLQGCHKESALPETLPIAILTTSVGRGETFDFDARTVDTSSLRLEHSGARALEAVTQCDVDGDGDVDLVFHFPTDEWAAASDEREICIIGTTTNGESFRGCTYHRPMVAGRAVEEPAADVSEGNGLLN